MRTRIIFSLNNRGGSVPFHHQALISSFIDEIKDELEADHKNYTGYNYSGLKGQTKVGKTGLHFFSSKVTLVFGCADELFLKAFLKKVFRREMILIGNLELIPLSVDKEVHEPLKGEQKYVCISPMVAAGPNSDESFGKDFMEPTSNEFSDLLYESTMNRMEKSGEFSSEDIESFFKFQIVPDKEYLDKLKARGKKFSRIYTAWENKEEKEVRGYTFPFTFFADERVQSFVFNNGFGEYGSEGFGMLDFANDSSANHVEPYEFNE